MNVPDRLAEIVAALRSLEGRFLVMGGQAVRHYGVDRNTLDYDLHLSVDQAATLLGRLQTEGLPGVAAGPLAEGASWRARAFRRFQIGVLPDGRAEWLEFWLHNHLLPAFDELWSRREEREWRGVIVPYLGLDDLLRSKETERESDWEDIARLEEIADARRLAAARDQRGTEIALAGLRSRRGFEEALHRGWLANADQVGRALTRVVHPVTEAYLLPAATIRERRWFAGLEAAAVMIEPLRTVTVGSGRHLALVEAVRRLAKSAAVAADRADKEREVRASQ